MHIYGVNHWNEIVEEQIKRIRDSGLIDIVDRIYYCVVSNGVHIIGSEKYYLLDYSDDMSLSESFTLNRIREKALEEEFKAFYIHTKGVTRPDEMALQHWRYYMEYFCINCWHWCLEALNHADTAGVNIRVYGRQHKRFHYSGNFWWANSSYIKTLPELSKEGYGREVNRWDSEFWIGDGKGSMMSLYESRLHHGTTCYPTSMYEGKSPTMRLYGRSIK